MPDRNRDLVEDLLLAELGRRLRPRFLERLPLIGRGVARRRQRRDTSPQLVSALQSLGLLGAEEAATWERRLTEAPRNRGVRSEAWAPEARTRAEAHLHALDSDPGSHAYTARETYETTGVLRRTDDDNAEDAEPDDPEGESEDDGIEFPDELGSVRAVVLGPSDPIRGLRLVATELYDGGVVIRWHRLRTARHDDLCADRARRVTLTDEHGTHYALIGGAASQSSHATSGSWWFEPGAPEHWEQLELEAFGARFAIVRAER